MAQKRLGIVGAGPKAAAIIARAAVLRDLIGVDKVPEILVFESDDIGAAWSGFGNFSNGFMPLCTPGEKDVCFPYFETKPFGRFAKAPAPLLFAQFSFHAYLIANGKYADWVDRDRTPPSHSLFADYLNWVFDQANQNVVGATVARVWSYRDKWCLELTDSGGASRQVVVDGVVLTGAGEPRTVTLAHDVPLDKVFTAEDFWPARNNFLGDGDSLEVAVVGDGGAAGAIVAWLAERYQEGPHRIWSISPMGTLFPRGDGFAERRWFSDPDGWQDLTEAHRRKLIERTEAGVISLRNKRVIDSSQRVNFLAGKLTAVTTQADQLALAIDYAGQVQPPKVVDLVVNAIGFDGWSRLKLVDHAAAQALNDISVGEKVLAAKREAAERKIESDLSMPASAGFPSGIHVPALSGFAQGPGMGNLGCLGLMAARILDPYLQ